MRLLLLQTVWGFSFYVPAFTTGSFYTQTISAIHWQALLLLLFILLFTLLPLWGRSLQHCWAWPAPESVCVCVRSHLVKISS